MANPKYLLHKIKFMHTKSKKQTKPSDCLKIVGFVFLTTVLVGCVSIRQLTYPSEFIWLEHEDVEGTMQGMSIHLSGLQTLVELHTETTDEQSKVEYQLEIIDGLFSLENLAASISPQNDGLLANDNSELPATNHLLVDEHIDVFVSQVMKARMLAENQPPNFYGVGQLIGTCNACHRQR